MSLTTILTLPAATPAEKARRTYDLLLSKVAVRLPQRLRYHVLISCGVQAFRGDEEVPAVTFMEVMERTPTGKGGA